MAKWVITTCGQVWQESADTYQEAIKKAWTRRPPDEVGRLVEIHPANNADDDALFYTSGERAIKLAGFGVEEA
jgi:hypothetical protein